MKKKIWFALFAAAVIINLVAWNSSAFCDWHIRFFFPVSINTYGRMMSVVPFSVGEWMIVFGLLLLAEALILGLVRLFVKKEWVKKLCSGFYKGFAWVLLAVFWIMTCNCFLLYHASPIDEKYMPEKTERTYTDTELAAVRDYIVTQLNELTELMERDDAGYLVYDEEISDGAIRAMQKLGNEYGQLAGYYPKAKTIHSSDFLSQEHMMGYYFPFSMEANYNKTMYVVNKPATICHELAHLKGFIYEDEANFIGFLACVSSDDLFFRYSGYMSVLGYVENEFRDSVNHKASAYFEHPEIARSVYDDDLFLTAEAWEKVEEKAVIQTAVVKKASNQFMEATLKLNGVEDGMKSYSRVVQLLLKYYDGILY